MRTSCSFYVQHLFLFHSTPLILPTVIESRIRPIKLGLGLRRFGFVHWPIDTVNEFVVRLCSALRVLTYGVMRHVNVTVEHEQRKNHMFVIRCRKDSFDTHCFFFKMKCFIQASALIRLYAGFGECYQLYVFRIYLGLNALMLFIFAPAPLSQFVCQRKHILSFVSFPLATVSEGNCVIHWHIFQETSILRYI